MKNFWAHMHGKLGGKQLFEFIEERDLHRPIRLIAVECLRTNKDTKFFIGLSKLLPDIPSMHPLAMTAWARFLPPWWVGKFYKNINGILGNNAPSEIGFRINFSTTPRTESVDSYFDDIFTRVVKSEVNRKKVRALLKSKGVRKNDVRENGFQPNNGLIMLNSGQIILIPRWCYDIFPNEFATPGQYHSVNI